MKVLYKVHNLKCLKRNEFFYIKDLCQSNFLIFLLIVKADDKAKDDELAWATMKREKQAWSASNTTTIRYEGNKNDSGVKKKKKRRKNRFKLSSRLLSKFLKESVRSPLQYSFFFFFFFLFFLFVFFIITVYYYYQNDASSW